jgi:hypothetical protein
VKCGIIPAECIFIQFDILPLHNRLTKLGVYHCTVQTATSSYDMIGLVTMLQNGSWISGVGHIQTGAETASFGRSSAGPAAGSWQ